VKLRIELTQGDPLTWDDLDSDTAERIVDNVTTPGISPWRQLSTQDEIVMFNVNHVVSLRRSG